MNYTKKEAIKINKTRQEKMKLHIKESLKQMDFEFENDKKLMSFISKRVNCVTYKDNPRKDLFLDYISTKEKGTLICSYTD